jgi:hypothetical protein
LRKREPRARKPWRKLQPIQHSSATRLDLFKAATDNGDAAALVQVVRDHYKAGTPVPEWVVLALEGCLGAFVSLAANKKNKTSKWVRWARRHRRTLLDSAVAERIRLNLDLYDGRAMTWAEACDEAADWFSGTPAAGSPASMMATYKRDKRAGVCRPWTQFEMWLIDRDKLGTRPFRPSAWWATNCEIRRGWTRRVA